MRLPITDKFLWDVYNFFEKIGDINDLFSPRPWKEVWCPELHKFWYEYRKKQERARFSRLIYYLKKKGYIKIKNLENKEGVILTPKGIKKALKIKFRIKKKKKRSDGKWQMTAFDIPEKKRKERDLFREDLQSLGYIKLQKSIWVCPYNVLEETQKLIQIYDLEPYVKLFLIEEIEI